MRFKYLAFVTALVISTNINAIENQPGCEPEMNSLSVGCLFERDSNIPENLMLNVLDSRDQYLQSGMTNQDAIFHAINLEMIKTHAIHKNNIEQLEKLWQDIKENQVVLD